MTHPSWNPPPHNPFDSSAPGPGYPGPAPQPPGPGGEVNTLATLSVIFAFVFAPAGAILGHLGLSQISRSRQRGHDRALVGVTLSYVVIAAAVVALIVWATLGHNDTHPAVASPTTSAAPAATPPPPPPPPPPPATVTPADLAGLVPTLAEVKNVIGDDNLTLFHESRQLEDDTQGATLDRPECLPVLESADPQAYNMPAITGVYGTEIRDFTNMSDPIQTGSTVVAFRDISAARAQLESLLSAWRQCANSTVVTTYPSKLQLTHRLPGLTDAGNGITTMPVEIVGRGLTVLRLVAVKANVVVDSLTTYKTSRNEQQHAVALVNAILAKIPG